MRNFVNKHTFFTIFSLIFLFLFSAEINAQLLKRLQQKVESKVEETITNKVADKADRETGKAMDKMLDPEMMKTSPMALGIESGNMDEVPESYEFDWVYVLDMTTDKAEENIQMEYWLRKDAPYWGFKMSQGVGMTMVYDLQNNFTVLFMNNDGKSFASVTKMPKDLGEDDNDEDSIPDFKIKEIPGKVILGYKCKGYLADTDEYEMTMYIAPDAEVSMGKMYSTNQKFPKSYSFNWTDKALEDGLMMEMRMVDKKKPKNNMTMQCVKLEKQHNKIKKSDYQNM